MKWKSPVGVPCAEAVAGGDRVFCLGDVKSLKSKKRRGFFSYKGEAQSLLCFDWSTGRKLWQTSVKDRSSGVTRIVHGEGILACLGEEGVHGVSPSDGKHTWTWTFGDKVSGANGTAVSRGPLRRTA